MTPDVARSKQRFIWMMVLNTIALLVGAGFAVGHFVYGVEWMLWAFFGFLAAGFVAQLWFIRGVARMSKGG